MIAHEIHLPKVVKTEKGSKGSEQPLCFSEIKQDHAQDVAPSGASSRVDGLERGEILMTIQ